MNVGKEFSHTCIIPGCDNPRTLMATDKESRYCREHLEAIYERAAARRSKTAKEKRGRKKRKCERVVIVDYADDCLLYVSGEIEQTEALPDTDEKLQLRLAALADDGFRIARPVPYRQVDVNQYRRLINRR